jgi:hypothetical protein
MRTQLFEYLRRVLDRERRLWRLPSNHIGHDKYGSGTFPVL